MRIGVIIAAAGKSTRFGAGDKLSQDLGGRAVLLRTVEAFTKRDEVATIVVAGPPDDLEGFRSRFGPALGFNGARVVAGGVTERWATIKNALAELPDDLTPTSPSMTVPDPASATSSSTACSLPPAWRPRSSPASPCATP